MRHHCNDDDNHHYVDDDCVVKADDNAYDYDAYDGADVADGGSDDETNAMITSACQHILLTGLFLLVLFSDCTSSLKCYECDNELTNNFCMSELNLHDCGPSLDTCQTIVAYSDVSEKLSIIKTCSVNASCHIQKQENKDIPCDKTKSKWVCTSCCHEDGCNISGQEFVQSSFSYIQLLIVALLATDWTRHR